MNRESSPLLTPELKAALLRLPRYARLAWSLARDPRVPPGAKAVLAGGVLYSVSPIDLVPGFIPVVGQLDDLLVLLAALAQALRAIGPDASAVLLTDAGITQDDLTADRQAVAAALGTAARETWRISKAGARAAVHAVGWLGAAGARLAGQAGRYAWQTLSRSRHR